MAIVTWINEDTDDPRSTTWDGIDVPDAISGCDFAIDAGLGPLSEDDTGRTPDLSAVRNGFDVDGRNGRGVPAGNCEASGVLAGFRDASCTRTDVRVPEACDTGPTALAHMGSTSDEPDGSDRVTVTAPGLTPRSTVFDVDRVEGSSRQYG